jgi:hypothetical protein
MNSGEAGFVNDGIGRGAPDIWVVRVGLNALGDIGGWKREPAVQSLYLECNSGLHAEFF